MKKMKHSFIMALFGHVAILLLVGTAAAMVLNTVYVFLLSSATSARYDLTYYANQFMDASAYLTEEVRAYAATGLQVHYDNYWNEVTVAKNRDNGMAMLKKIGITEEEQALIDEMSALSDALIPWEAKAMTLASVGDNDAALEIVYGAEYNASVAHIVSLRDQFLEKLNQRTAEHTDHVTTFHKIVNILTWIMVGATILLQVFQKRGLHRLAYVDPLTGWDNYTSFREKMRAGAVSGEGYVVSVDLRSFSTINDTCGVAKGDEVIKEMSGILVAALHHGELAAHVSGDRFVLFLHSKSQEALMERLAAMRSDIIDLSPLLDVPHIIPLFGVRAVDKPDHPERAYGDANLAKQQLLDRADSFCAVFDTKTQETILENQHLEDNFEQALQEHQFEMWYQPKFVPDDRHLAAAEALVRWRNPDGSMTPPGKFIPLFECNGMIAQLDEYTFETVCAQQRAWLDAGLEIVPVSINVSRASLLHADIVGRYMVIANRYQIPAKYLELEITESAMDSTSNIDTLIQQFRSCGFHILVDDFGSGYSSLSILTKRFFDNIKLDKSLVDCIGTPEGDSLLESIIHLAHKFHMTVTAEGVEHAEQSEFLMGLSVDNIQGYYFSRPLPVPDFQGLLPQT